MSGMLRVGDLVIVAGGFGTDPPRMTTVKAIEVIEHHDDNEGSPVDELPWLDVKGCRVELDDGPWAYGGQLTRPELVIGQCPACSEINRHSDRCPRRGGASPAERVMFEQERTRVVLINASNGGTEWTGTLAAFFEANRETIDGAERTLVVKILDQGGVYHFGGGAAPLTWLKRIDDLLGIGEAP